MKMLHITCKDGINFIFGKLKEKKGLAQIPIIVGLLIMAAAIPIATNLVQKNQENRSKATGFNVTVDRGETACGSVEKNKVYECTSIKCSSNSETGWGLVEDCSKTSKTCVESQVNGKYTASCQGKPCGTHKDGEEFCDPMDDSMTFKCVNGSIQTGTNCYNQDKKCSGNKCVSLRTCSKGTCETDCSAKPGTVAVAGVVCDAHNVGNYYDGVCCVSGIDLNNGGTTSDTCNRTCPSGKFHKTECPSGTTESNCAAVTQPSTCPYVYTCCSCISGTPSGDDSSSLPKVGESCGGSLNGKCTNVGSNNANGAACNGDSGHIVVSTGTAYCAGDNTIRCCVPGAPTGDAGAGGSYEDTCRNQSGGTCWGSANDDCQNVERIRKDGIYSSISGSCDTATNKNTFCCKKTEYKKPNFTVSVNNQGNKVTISISGTSNVDHAATMESSKYLGLLSGNTYEISNATVGQHTYTVRACSVDTNNTIYNNSCPGGALTEKSVSVTVKEVAIDTCKYPGAGNLGKCANGANCGTDACYCWVSTVDVGVISNGGDLAVRTCTEINKCTGPNGKCEDGTLCNKTNSKGEKCVCTSKNGNDNFINVRTDRTCILAGAEVSCVDRCSSNYGCMKTGVYTGLGDCDHPKEGTVNYYKVAESVCGKKNGAGGGNDNACNGTCTPCSDSTLAKGRNLGNFNCSGVVDAQDFLDWKAEYIIGDQKNKKEVKNNWKGDADCNGLVNLTDLDIWLRNRSL